MVITSAPRSWTSSPSGPVMSTMSAPWSGGKQIPASRWTVTGLADDPVIVRLAVVANTGLDAVVAKFTAGVPRSSAGGPLSGVDAETEPGDEPENDESQGHPVSAGALVGVVAPAAAFPVAGPPEDGPPAAPPPVPPEAGGPPLAGGGDDAPGPAGRDPPGAGVLEPGVAPDEPAAPAMATQVGT